MDTQTIIRKIGDLSEKSLAARAKFLDRVITVSTGSLAFSVTFRSSMAGDGPSQIWLLKAAWIGLGISSICGVFSHLSTASAAVNAVKELQVNPHTAGAAPHPIYKSLYILAIVFFPIGIAGMMAFGIINTN